MFGNEEIGVEEKFKQTTSQEIYSTAVFVTHENGKRV
jgi:hypothetical protein